MSNKNTKELWEIFVTFFKIGAFTIGGGYAMLPLIEKEVVDHRHWVNEEEIVDIFAIVQSVPGVIAINTSMFVGYKIAKIKGAISAALGVILPSFLIILAIYYVMSGINENEFVQKAFEGIRAGVTALILLTAIKLSKKTIKSYVSAILAAIAFILMVFFKTNAIVIVLGGGIAGYIMYMLRKVKKI
ncbi:chromate transporter [Acetivibrio cellulolyticus]|uniref:chromate transporter n=1 Tax=Acetivibrio cellulolyticus TaxID=35830 RepID=UPI0001E2E76B|nr:chromate transporter [Acetivibrio cellulolyticus]